MAVKKVDDSAYVKLKKDLREGTPENLYIFWGDERYLLSFYLGELRKKILDGGMEEFNHRRFEGKNLSMEELSEAVDTLPVFAERTLIEVSDFDVFGCREEQKNALRDMIANLPEYVCLVFVYDTVEYKCDSRIKINTEMKKRFSIVEFRQQNQSDLTNWIGRRFKALGKSIDRPTAEYLAFVSGGLMNTLVGEIEKVGAYCQSTEITRESIDAVVTPVLDAVTYKLTDAVLQRKFDDAADMLSDLLAMQEPAHKIIFSLSLKMRQLLAARVCVESGKSYAYLMDIYAIKSDYAAKTLHANAGKVSLSWCKNAVRLCAETAVKMNSESGDYSEQLSSLLVGLATLKR